MTAPGGVGRVRASDGRNPGCKARIFQVRGRMGRGLFVSFEGSEGCGKSTQIGRLRRTLEGQGSRFLITREPGGTPLGESIRELLQFAPEGEGMCPEAELLLFAASRAQLVREVIRPALASGRHVLADRFLDSTTVYQGIARRLGREVVGAVNRLAVGDCLPDITFLLDMDAGAAWTRARQASQAEGKLDRMEREALSFYEIVREGYQDLALGEPERFVVIDANRDEETVAGEIWNRLKDRLDELSR